jgi:predicted unusual protein kinase regulating ubiquinone biosynthesis (AarF/ABC1/UbiB family)
VLEGLALSADPDYKLLAKAYPYMARRLLTDPEPELRATFEELMLKDGRFRWNRLINLLNESRKSQDFKADRIWLLADWFLSDDAATIRQKVVEVCYGASRCRFDLKSIIVHVILCDSSWGMSRDDVNQDPDFFRFGRR